MRLLLWGMLLTTLAACATLTADSDQPIQVTTTPAGAACTLVNSQGSWTIAKTPGTANVKRSFSPLTITCDKPHHGTGIATLEAETRNRAYGNLLMVGIPAVVDAGTGDGYEYAPATVEIELTK